MSATYSTPKFMHSLAKLAKANRVSNKDANAKKVAKATGARVVEMANQVGAREGVDDYLEMVDWNVRHVADALVDDLQLDVQLLGQQRGERDERQGRVAQGFAKDSAAMAIRSGR